MYCSSNRDKLNMSVFRSLINLREIRSWWRRQINANCTYNSMKHYGRKLSHADRNPNIILKTTPRWQTTSLIICRTWNVSQMCFILLTPLKVEEVRALNNMRYVFYLLLPQEIIWNATVFRNLTLPLNDTKFTFWFTMFLWIVLPGCLFFNDRNKTVSRSGKITIR